MGYIRKRFKIGVSANLIPGISVHTDTFIRAITMGVASVDSFRQNKFELVWANDHSSFSGGDRAALKLVESRVELVVGHYASSAAKGALPHYAKANVPVLLPAATADCLTGSFENAFRLCRNDKSLADFIFQFLYKKHAHQSIALLNDNSIHGLSLSGSLLACCEHQFELVNLDDSPNAVIFIGSYKNSLCFLESFRLENIQCPVYFTDDVVFPDIVKDTKHLGNLFIFGSAPCSHYPEANTVVKKYQQTYNEQPSTYFIETYAAMQIAASVAEQPGFETMKQRFFVNHSWQTAMGQVRFSSGECHNSQFCIWHIDNDGILNPYKH